VRVDRRKREVLFVGGWVLVSSLLLLAAARAEDSPVTYSGPASAAPQASAPKNQSSPDEILKKARTTLPADQYEAFERAMKKLESGTTSNPLPSGGTEPVLDGSNIPSIISFDRPGPGASSAPARAPAAGPDSAAPAPVLAPVPATVPQAAPSAAPAPAAAAPVAAAPSPPSAQQPKKALSPAPGSTAPYDPAFPSSDPVK